LCGGDPKRKVREGGVEIGELKNRNDKQGGVIYGSMMGNENKQKCNVRSGEK